MMQNTESLLTFLTPVPAFAQLWAQGQMWATEYFIDGEKVDFDTFLGRGAPTEEIRALKNQARRSRNPGLGSIPDYRRAPSINPQATALLIDKCIKFPLK